MMKKIRLVAILSATFAPALGLAQMVSTPEQPEICPERPGEPEIIANMDFRDSHKTRLLQRMYVARSFELIVDQQNCTCDNRFPSWEPVVNYYLEHYAGIEDRHEIYAAQDPYDDAVNARRSEARELCVAAGNWN
jgi:hypothetical protein